MADEAELVPSQAPGLSSRERTKKPLLGLVGVPKLVSLQTEGWKLAGVDHGEGYVGAERESITYIGT